MNVEGGVDSVDGALSTDIIILAIVFEGHR
jgi:hypothetical protein